MKKYFLISEFAKLRGININSLRYYEKLGLLKPAYTDENTGYRYYAPEQVSVLNKIILCIKLGIPLKEMVKYIDNDGNLQSQKLLEQGKIEAKKRIEEMQNNLYYIEASLKNIEISKEFAGKEGIYTRHIDERKVIVTDYFEHRLEIKEIVSEMAEIYKIALKNDFFPILPAGMLIKIDAEGNTRFCWFLEILNHKKKHPRVFTLCAGKYSCMQLDLKPEIDLFHVINKNWHENGKKIVIVDNVMLEKYSFESKPSELQKFIE